MVVVSAPPLAEGTVLWRAVAFDACHAGGDQRTHVYYQCWRVERVTPAGAWLVRVWSEVDIEPVDSEVPDRCWRGRVDRFASETKEGALHGLLVRTRRWVRIEEARLDRARRRLENVREMYVREALGKRLPEAT